MTDNGTPLGRDAVMTKLTEATIRLVVEQGTHVSVRQIATEAGVNHGLVHTYFGSKQLLIDAAFDEINRRAGADVDSDGFPPADLALRRGGELAKAVARMRLDHDSDLFSSHPVLTSWINALTTTRPDLNGETIENMVIKAATLALGWSVFADHLCAAIGLSDERRSELDERIAALVAELGGLPDSSDGP